MINILIRIYEKWQDTKSDENNRLDYFLGSKLVEEEEGLVSQFLFSNKFFFLVPFGKNWEF